MSTSDVLVELARLGVPAGWYRIGGKGPSENRTILQPVGNLWEVYYSERGSQHELKTFASEDEACRELLARMKRKKEWTIRLR